jgi:hypothetical protein
LLLVKPSLAALALTRIRMKTRALLVTRSRKVV